MAKSTRNTEKNNMSSADALAALGLTDDAAEVTETAVETSAETAAETVETASELTPTEEPNAANDSAGEPGKPDHAEREEVEIGELEFGVLDFIPTSRRQAGGSKYKFDSLKSPAENGGKYSFFKVAVLEGVEPNKLKRSVQSATTQANKQNPGKYFITRTVNEDGKLVAMQVIRTDARPESGEDDQDA